MDGLKPGFRMPTIEMLRGFALGRHVSNIRKSKGKMTAGHAAWKRELDKLLKEEAAAGRKTCEHSKQRSHCKECGGSSIYEHGRRRYQCKQCGGCNICKHGRRRRRCKECGGSGICEYRKQILSCECDINA